MADKSYDQAIWNVRERPLSSDLNQEASEVSRSVRESLRRLFAGRLSNTDASDSYPSGFLGNSFKVVPNATAMDVDVSVGLGFQDIASGTLPSGVNAIESNIAPTDGPGAINLDDLERYKPLVLTAAQTFTVPAAPAAGHSRIDIIEVRADRFTKDPASRDILDTGTGVFVPDLVDKTLSFVLDGHMGSVLYNQNSTAPVSYKSGNTYVGTAWDASKIPATTSGWIKICEIFVGPTVSDINGDVINDTRPQLSPGDSKVVGCQITMTMAGGAAALTQSASAPGINIVATSPGAGANAVGQFDLYVIGGASEAALSGLPQVSVTNQQDIGVTAGAADTVIPRVTFLSIGRLTSGDVTNINDATKSSNPSLVVAVGQPCVHMQVQSVAVFNNDPGVTDVAHFESIATALGVGFVRYAVAMELR